MAHHCKGTIAQIWGIRMQYLLIYDQQLMNTIIKITQKGDYIVHTSVSDIQIIKHNKL